MSVCAKVMSRGVHNIAFSLSPDGFWASDLGNEPESGLKIKEGGGFCVIYLLTDALPHPNSMSSTQIGLQRTLKPKGASSNK
jgi:hypothetical protein